MVAPLVRRIAPGREVRYTTGPGTRAALAAAGARAATTGTVLHLPAAPSTDPKALGTLAHELSHAAEGGRRTEFLLRSPVGSTGHAGERRARQLGELVRRAATEAPVAFPVRDGVNVGALPIGGAGFGGVSVGRAAAADARGGMKDRVVPGQVPANYGQPGHDAAAAGQVPPADGLSASAGQIVYPPVGGGAGAPAIARQVTHAREEPVASVDHRGTTADPDSPLGELIEALQEHLLLEIERRGGRWAGVF